MVEYQTRITEHVDTVNRMLAQKKLPPLRMTDVARGADVPYSSLLRYANTKQTAPNYAFVDKVRLFLNGLLPRSEQFSDASYLYIVEEIDPGQPAGV